MPTLSPPRRPSIWLEPSRRGVWLLLQLLLVSLFVFATLGRSNSRRELPLFVNTRPTYLAEETWRLAQSVGHAEGTNPEASKSLLELGGASLPHLLPKLDSLPPEARLAVLQALAPLAVRMQLSAVAPSPAESESLWMSFWNDHFVDFHPAMARRVVRRFVQGPTPQRTLEVRRLDTFALPELLRELTRVVRERADGEVVGQVLELLCSITVDPQAPCGRFTTESPRNWRIVEAWREWWLRERHRFETPNGAERLLAPILQTEYAAWVRTSTRALLTGRAFSDVPWREGLFTSLQLALALLTTWLVPRVLRPARDRLPRGPLIVAAVLTSLPWLLWLTLAPWAMWLGFGGIGALSGLGLGLWSAVYSRTVSDEVNVRDTTYVFSSNLLGVILAAEGLLEARGLGPTLIGAVQAGNLRATIGAALICAVTLAACNGLLGLSTAFFARAGVRR